MEKLAAGSTLSNNQQVTATGNTANAQLAARNTAQAVSLFLSQLQFHTQTWAHRS
jgi:hypothetical protein